MPDAIAIANYDFGASGTVAKSIQIARALSDADVPVELWAMHAAGPLLARTEGLTVIEVGGAAGSGKKRAGALLKSVPALAAEIRSRAPAVFLSGGKHFHLGARIAMGLSGRRERTAFGGRASNSAWRPRQSGAQRAMSDAALRFKYGDMDFVVAVSGEIAGEIRTKVPKVAPRIATIFNGVDRASVVARAADGFTHPFVEPGGPPLLISVGRISPQKGFDLLIEAVALVNRTRPVRLLVVGDGPDRAMRDLRALAQARGIADQVDFLGYLANPFAALARADLFVCASRWEGASNALIEALVCGLPLVATDCPTGNREILGDGRFGTLARPEDIDGIARAILAELAAPRRRDAQHAASARFELDRCLNAYVDLLTAQRDRVIARGARRA